MLTNVKEEYYRNVILLLLFLQLEESRPNLCQNIYLVYLRFLTYACQLINFLIITFVQVKADMEYVSIFIDQLRGSRHLQDQVLHDAIAGLLHFDVNLGERVWRKVQILLSQGIFSYRFARSNTMCTREHPQ